MTSEYETSEPTRNGDLDGRSLKDEVKRLVEARLAEYTSELDQKIEEAADKIVQHNQERHPYVKQEIRDALFGMEHVISAAYIPLESSYWHLYIIHDSDRMAEITEQLIDKIIKVEDLPSVPLLDPKIMRASRTARMPNNAELIFEKR